MYNMWSLDDCKQYCLDDPACVAINWDEYQLDDPHCWTLDYTDPMESRMLFTVYILNDPSCRSSTTLAPGAPSPCICPTHPACESACLEAGGACDACCARE